MNQHSHAHSIYCTNTYLEQILLLLCGEQEQDEEGANGGSIDSQETTPTIPSILLLDDSSSSQDEAVTKTTARDRRKTTRKEERQEIRETDGKAPPSPASEARDKFGAFVAKEPVFQAILRQMRGGTSVSKETAARVRSIARR